MTIKRGVIRVFDKVEYVDPGSVGPQRSPSWGRSPGNDDLWATCLPEYVTRGSST